MHGHMTVKKVILKIHLQRVNLNMEGKNQPLNVQPAISSWQELTEIFLEW